ncbi:UNVERIFIED_ORG: hypothetical protein J2W38_006320 [Variovorax paradoxus]|nr:hypothetical protein [Variovorax paradoxus]
MDDDFSIDAPYSPVIAVLFLSKERVEVAVEGEPDIHCFATENSDAGLSEFEQQLSACKFWARPIITLCMSPDGAFRELFPRAVNLPPDK